MNRRNNSWQSCLVLFLISVQALGVPTNDYILDLVRGADAKNTRRPSSVYVYGDQSLDVLMQVRILGAVQNAGLHFVPKDTDLLTLISLAGGTQEGAEINRVIVKRITEKGTVTSEYDLEELVSDTHATTPTVMPNDTVLIPKKADFISKEVLQTVGLVAGLATIFGTLVLGVANLK